MRGFEFMLLSFALIIFLGLVVHWIFTKVKLPGIIGMMLVGVTIGPYVLNLIDQSVLAISEDIRSIALVVILLRAGFGIKKESFKQVGRPTILLSFLPGILEGITIAFVAMVLLGFDFSRGGILGFTLAAVSPAIIVPLMIYYNDKKIGTNKNIPTMILTAASVDDVFAITIFGVFVGIYTTQNTAVLFQLINIPIAIILGVVMGILSGFILMKLFNHYHIRNTKKIMLVISIAILLVILERAVQNYIAIASLLGVMALAFYISNKKPPLGDKLADKLSKIWILVEIFLFVLIGAAVNINVLVHTSIIGVAIIMIGLIARTIGVYISLIKTPLMWKEKLFVSISYLPKATVQAAIGSIPLTLGIPGGDIILAIAVLAIVITAPLGAILITTTSNILLTTDK